jgi:hypothetical protein
MKFHFNIKALFWIYLVSELYCDRRFTANQFVLATNPLRLTMGDFFQLNFWRHSPYMTSGLTRGWVCYLQLLLALASSVILRSESRGTHNHILLSQVRESPNLEGQVPVFISRRNRVAQLYPQVLGRHLRRAKLRWRYSNLPPRLFIRVCFFNDP